ncbi:MAG: CPBP family intramembrane glutamic endopeptidase [Brumimicrobium sp.]
MQPKIQFHILGWITFLLFPTIAFLALWFFEDIHFLEILELDNIFTLLTLVGLAFGLLYGIVILGLTQFPIFEEMSSKQERILKSLNLGWGDVFFMSFCAGFGEEILFRAGIQTWLGPWLTTFIFIAIHGYFNPLSWKQSMMGVVLFPFILSLAYAYESYGLWFCVAAHFSYDLIMFSMALKSTDKQF